MNRFALLARSVVCIAAASLAASCSGPAADRPDPLADPPLNSASALADMSANHIGIRVPDYEIEKRWWVEKLDFRIVAEWTYNGQKYGYLAPPNDDSFWVEILSGGTLRPQRSPDTLAQSLENPGYHHLSFKVASLAKTLETLRSRSATILQAEPLKVGQIDAAVFFIKDPYGNVVEFMEHPAAD